MSVHLDDRGRWIVMYREGGKQHKKIFKDEQAARLYDDQRRQSPGLPPKPTLGQLLPAFQNHLRLNGRGERYIEDMKRIIEKYNLDHIPLNKFDFARDFEQFSGMTSITRNRYLSYVKVFFNWCCNEGHLQVNPLSKWKKTAEPPRRLSITVEDLKKIVAVASPHLKWAIEVAYHVGCRPGETELCQLKWSDIDFDRNEVNVYASKTKSYRKVPCDQVFIDKLRSHVRDSLFVVSYKGRAMKCFQRSWRTACTKAKLESTPVFYEVRHLFATELLRNGADLAAVSKILGHKRISMTADVYYEYLEAEKRRAISKLPALG